ncbi:Putative uncharacterized protein [Taphrina deformans PYCC 5710]|uniref:Coatomer subunit delta n=1 Tax=Taphrina deformans (strain PYCC 5710 / ATCC 11124 / CBS 356.35 / IMI 108563 / JCM 9778 / NBRC 8474) TaxID=1097556 RepID=R4X7I8_TAPDE|nr:Putative uncharacterized protein [Taphrina deformans PYCC 5710]|eukprot:CCG81068.1 Putative uncharacterized protein [Taphrina deformans PYCC 5710]
MVVLAASICTRGGKAVLSRQFRDMPKCNDKSSRVEALLSSFPRLTNTGTQHTTVETDNVRYVYQPLEELYMVLITNRQSNILQDISTLHLFAQIVTSTCRNCNEAEILRHAFELLGAFDEVCCLGYRENLTLPQIKNFLEMDSHEEKIQEIIEKNKELEANEERKRRAKQLDQQRKELQKRGAGANSSFNTGGYSAVSSRPTYNESPSIASQPAFESKLTKAASAPRGKGMALGKKSKQSDLFEAVRGEAEASPLISAPETPAYEEPPTKQAAVDTESIHVKITEHLSAKANRDGGIESMDVKGDLTLLISDRDQGKAKILCDLDNALPGVQMKTHPKVDKSAWSSNSTIALGDVTKSFPIDTSIGVVRWNSKQVPSDFNLPVTLTCWPNVGNGTCDVTVEFEHTGDRPVKNVVVSIPLLNDQDPQIGDSTVAESQVSVHSSTSNLEWSIPTISSDESSGSLEFTCSADDADEFFPITITYEQESPLCGLDVADVVAASGGEGGVQFSKELIITGTIQVV